MSSEYTAFQAFVDTAGQTVVINVYVQPENTR